MGLWQGNLANTPIDLVIDTILLLALAAAHVPQIARICARKSTKGISPNFLLFNALYSNIQFAQALALHARAYPTNENGIEGTAIGLIWTGKIAGAEAYGALLGLLQVAVQWLGTMIVTILYSYYSPPRTVPVAKIALAHAATFLLPTVYFCTIRPLTEDLASGLLLGLNNRFWVYLTLAMVTAQISPQVVVMRRMAGSPRSLSLSTLSLQSIFLVIIALRWLFRFGSPDWSYFALDANGSASVCMRVWRGAVMLYHWGFVPFNYLIDGCGTMLLVALYHMRRIEDDYMIGGAAAAEAEKEPLLSG